MTSARKPLIGAALDRVLSRELELLPGPEAASLRAAFEQSTDQSFLAFTETPLGVIWEAGEVANARGHDIREAMRRAMMKLAQASRERERIAAWASTAAPRAPRLTPRATKRQLLGWLAWNDPNGEWGNHLEALDRIAESKTDAVKGYPAAFADEIDEEADDFADDYEQEFEIPTVDELWDHLGEMMDQA
jgi:hypothetical protein